MLRRALPAMGMLALGLPATTSAAPPPASEYQARHVCSAPARGDASCLALVLAPKTATARARTQPRSMAHSTAIGMATSAAKCASEFPACLTPADLNDAYFPGEKPEAPASQPQTIALVDAYDDPHAESDLKVYDEEFKLPACTEANGCFKKLNQSGEAGHPPVAVEAEKEEAEGWALEIATDIEVAHAVCQNCRIVLVEADNPSIEDLVAAEKTATGVAGASEVSNSWGGSEAEVTNREVAAFDRPGTVITASAGDDGYLSWDEWEGEALDFDEPDFPSSSPNVVAVGGTKLTMSGDGWGSERVWNEDPNSEGLDEGATGGGCSLRFPAQPWQQAVADWAAVGCEDRRAVADVSADADPDSGVAVYDSVPYPYEESGKKKTEVLDWVPIGGTSVASPIIASMFALAGGAHEVAYPAATLYSHLGTGLLHDVTVGGSGDCDDDYAACSGSMRPLSPFDCGEGALICNAAVGYDGPTGVGTPNGIGAFELGSEAAIKKQKAEEEAAAARKAKESQEAREVREASEAKETQQALERAEAERNAAKKIEEEKANGGEPTGSASGHEGTTGNASPSGATAGQPSGSPSVAASAGGANSGHGTVLLSNLALTARASAVFARGLPTISQVAFAFTLSAPARVGVKLSRLRRIDGRLRWVSARGGFTLTAGRGRGRSHLRGHGTLPAGRYRLTLRPAHGAARSLTFLLG